MTDRERWLEQAELWSSASQCGQFDIPRVYITLYYYGGASTFVCGVCQTLDMYPGKINARMANAFTSYFVPKMPLPFFWPLTKRGAECRVWACLLMAEVCDD